MVTKVQRGIAIASIIYGCTTMSILTFVLPATTLTAQQNTLLFSATTMFFTIVGALHGHYIGKVATFGSLAEGHD